jgi:hypothetical protein
MRYDLSGSQRWDSSVSIPQLNKGPNGAVLRISGTAPFKVEKVFQITTVGCVQPAGGPAGLTIGPDHQMLVGCNGTSTQSVIIDDRSTLAAAPIVIQFVPTPGGGVDEVWFDPGSNHYYLAQSTPGTMGVEDAGGGTTLPTTDPIATTATGSKNPAADPDRNLVYLPVLANDGTICSTNKDHNGNAGNDKQGCIAIYSAPLDSDDLPVRRRAQK